MKFYFSLIIGILFLLNSYAQVSKIYVTSGGMYSADPKYAVSYNLIEKIDDSAYRVSNYNMNDTIIYQGIYKDELLTIPNGRFVYYSKTTPRYFIKMIFTTKTNNFICKVGYFSNGVKTGMWTEFEQKGLKKCTYIYKRDKLNGLYQEFEKRYNNYVIEEGYYVDDKKEGVWNIFGLDTLYAPQRTKGFSNDKLIKETVRYKNFVYPNRFTQELLNKISLKGDTARQNVKIKITVNKDGTISNSKITNSHSPKIDQIVLDFFNKSKFTPSSYDEKPINITCELEIAFWGGITKPTDLLIFRIPSSIINKEDFVKTNN